MVRTLLRRLMQIFVSIGLIELFSHVHLSMKIGSYMPTFFSATHCFSPLLGIFNHTAVWPFVFLLRACGKTFFLHSTANILLVYNIPSLCGALYFSLIGTTLIRKLALCAIPVSCMILFLAHPTGWQAAPYALYWLIPIMTILVKHNSFFLHALGSTFTTHAVGSVLWLYTKSIPASVWLGLIPVVFIERLAFSLGMVICYYGVRSAQSWLTAAIKKLRLGSYYA